MKKSLLILSLILLNACAHHRDVRPGAEGIHTVKVKGENGEDSAREAMSQANHFCDKRDQYAAVVTENTKYAGKNMSEKTYNKAKMASKVVAGLGSAAFVFGKRDKTQRRGMIAGAGAGVANEVIGEGYQTVITFRCK